MLEADSPEEIKRTTVEAKWYRGLTIGHLFIEDDTANGIPSQTAVLLGDGQTQPALLGNLLDKSRRTRRSYRFARQLRIAEVNDFLPELLLLFSESKVHSYPSGRFRACPYQ